MRKYETLMMASSDLEEPGLKALLDEVTALIVREGGVIKSVDAWGLRRLEYPIKHQESGRYAVINFEGEESTSLLDVSSTQRGAGTRSCNPGRLPLSLF